MISRSTIGLILAALLAAPAAAEAQAPGSGGFQLGGLVGFDLGDLDGFSLRGDGQFELARLAPNVTLSGVGSVGFTRVAESASGSFLGDSYDIDVSLIFLEFIPAARLTLEATPQLGFYGDLGLGIFWGRFKYDADEFGEYDDSEVSVAMRLGAGVEFAITPTAKLVGEMAYHPRFGDFGMDTFSIMAGAKFSL
jgi:opacity protein-like surface antigen